MPKSSYRRLWKWIVRSFDFSKYTDIEEAKADIESALIADGSIGALIALGMGIFDELILREILGEALPEYLPEWFEETEKTEEWE